MKLIAKLVAAALLCAASSVLPARADDASVHLTWLATARQSPTSNVPAIKDWFETRLAAWLKLHPNVSVEISYQSTDINAAMTRLQEQVNADRAPDFASLDSFFLSRFYAKLQPLDAYFPAGDADDFVGFAKAGMHGPDGKLKAIWVNTDVRALFYRKDLVPTPPKTWDDMLKLAASLSKQNMTPYVFPGGRGEAAVMEHLPMFWAMGGKLVDDKGRAVFGEGANRDDWVKILTFMKTLVATDASPRRVVNYANEADLYPEIMRGNVAMFLGGSWMPHQLGVLGDKHEWGIADIPMPGAVGPSTAAGGWTFGVFTPDAAKQKLITDLMSYLVAGKEGMAGAVTAEANLPTRASVAAMTTPYFLSAEVKDPSAMLRYAQARPGAAIYPSISTELQVAISSVISGQATPEAAIDTAWTKIRQQDAQ